MCHVPKSKNSHEILIFFLSTAAARLLLLLCVRLSNFFSAAITISADSKLPSIHLACVAFLLFIATSALNMYLKEINGSLFSISYPTASDSGRAFRRDINIF